MSRAPAVWLPKSKSGAPRRWASGRARYRAKVWWPDGKRDDVAVPERHCSSEARALEYAASLQEQLALRGAQALADIAPPTGETVATWFDRWTLARVAKGLLSARQDRGRFKKWVAPKLGPVPVASITRRHLEELVADLDLAVRAKRLSWKTARNTWGLVTKMFKDATRSKVLALRVREDNPAINVEGPDRGAERDGTYLFPSELAAVLRSSRVPARWKIIFVLCVYLYMRRGELEALEWNAVNFDLRYVHVHCSVDSETGEVKATKTKRNRKIPIEPGLLPLLVEMHRLANGKGKVIEAMPPRGDLPKKLRQYVVWALEEAGVPVRPELLANDETRRQINLHDLRHTGISWRAIRGDEPLQIKQAAGHEDFKTTEGYIEDAQIFDRALFGEVFALLPTSLAREARDSVSTFLSTPEGRGRNATKIMKKSVASPGGFEPPLAT